MRFTTGVLAMAAVALSIGAGDVFAQSLTESPDSGDTAWMLTSSALVLFMTIPGLALFYGGMVHANSVVSVFMQCFAITCLVTILWLVVGYSLAFGNSVVAVGDLSKVLYAGVGEDVLWGAIPEPVFATFQLTFAIITSALIVGTLVERIRFPAVLLFTALWTLLVYSPIAHWVWGGGWLGALGVLDFAGGLVVHVSAGTAGLVAAVALGPRHGFPGRIASPHNVAFTVAGASMLWVGWLGFNGGSAIAADGNAALAVAVTQIAAAAGAFTWMVVEWWRDGKPTALGIATGMVAGLATVTPAAGFVGPAGALVLGIVAGAGCLAAARVLRRRLGVDDSLDVVAVHLIGGMIGTILAGVLASGSLGVIGGQEDIAILAQLRVQVVGVVAVVIYTGAATWVILTIVRIAVRERVSPRMVAEGLDLSAHNERGYVLSPQHLAASVAAGRSRAARRRAGGGERPDAGGSGKAAVDRESKT